MFDVGVITTTCRPGDRDVREFSRIPVVIPVRVEIMPAPPTAGFAAVPGTLLNIGCGGGRVRLRWRFPPQTRLIISLPVGMPGFRLTAEVIWASYPSDQGPESAVYGVRWANSLSSAILESILMRQGLTTTREEPHAPSPRK
jgi:hypothetical protein